MKTPKEKQSASPSTRKEERRKKNGKSKEIVNLQNGKDKKSERKYSPPAAMCQPSLTHTIKAPYILPPTFLLS